MQTRMRSWVGLVVMCAGLAARAGAPGGLTLEQAQALLWRGELAAAEAAYLHLVAQDAGNVDAWLGLGQARRWSGAPLAARAALEEALKLAPQRGDVREELAWTYLAQGRPGEAEALLVGSPSAPLREELARQRRVTVTLSGTASRDSTQVEVGRVAPRLVASVALPGDGVLRVGVGYTQLGEQGTGAPVLRRRTAGASLRLPLGPLSVSGGAAVHQGPDALLTEGHLGLHTALSDRLQLGLRVRRRPFLEAADPLATDVEAFHSAGAGGTTSLDAVARRGVDEVVLALQGSPLSATYVYADTKVFRVTDGNRGWSAAAGAGLLLTQALGLRLPVQAVLRWDSYFTHFDAQRATYFSPQLLDSHSPGGELRVRLGEVVELSGEGGAILPLLAPGQLGWFGGGSLGVRFGRVVVEARGQVRQDTWYRSQRVWLATRVEL